MAGATSMVLQAVESDRLRVLEGFHEAILQPATAEEIALPTLMETLKPQKPQLSSEENHLLESGLRALLMDLVGRAVESHQPVMRFGSAAVAGMDGRGPVMRLLDLSLHLCEHGHTEAGMVFTLLEDLTEVSTIADCKEVFAYIESKQEVLGKAELLGRGKLVLLRACNQLLRRLSKANDVVFCGRILMFLAHFFPISERSAANIKGNFNTSNKTDYLKDETPEEVEDFKFYTTFWGLQEYFCQPPSLLQPAKWQQFTADITTVLDAFEAQPMGEEESSSVTGADATYNTKYLTSPNLLRLELRDRSFRRYILVQCLFIFDYLKAPGKGDKDEKKEALREEVKALEERGVRLLGSIPPKAKEFVRRMEHILEREHNWAAWKKDGCPAFDKPPAGGGFKEATQKRKPRYRMGNRELDRLFKLADKAPALTDAKRVKVPSVEDYFKDMAEDMDPENGIEAEYHHKNDTVYCWRGLRLAARQDIEGFSRFGDLGIEGVVPPKLLVDEVRQKLYPPKEAVTASKGKAGKLEAAKPAATPKAANQATSQSNGAPPPSSANGESTAGRETGEATPMELGGPSDALAEQSSQPPEASAGQSGPASRAQQPAADGPRPPGGTFGGGSQEQAAEPSPGRSSRPSSEPVSEDKLEADSGPEREANAETGSAKSVQVGSERADGAVSSKRAEFTSEAGQPEKEPSQGDAKRRKSSHPRLSPPVEVNRESVMTFLSGEIGSQSNRVQQDTAVLPEGKGPTTYASNAIAEALHPSLVPVVDNVPNKADGQQGAYHAKPYLAATLQAGVGKLPKPGSNL